MKQLLKKHTLHLTVIFSSLVLVTTSVHAVTSQQILNLADSSRGMTQRIAVQQAATLLSAESIDVDNDGYLEAPAMAGGGGPVGGGLIPSSSAAPKTDSYGSKLGYCSFDNGSTNTSAGRITGVVNSATAPVLAVISAGLDNTFQTSCADIASGVGAKGDDYVISYNSTQLQLGSRGSLYIGDPVANLATLNALDPAVLHEGEIRLVKDTNLIYRWNTATSTWLPISNQPWSKGVGSTYYSNNPIAIGTTNATNQLTVADPGAGVPISATTQGRFNGIELQTPTATNAALLGFDNTTNFAVVNAQNSGAGIDLQIAGASYLTIANNGSVNIAGNTNIGGTLNATSATFSGAVALNGGVTGNGSGLTNLNAGNLTGTISSAVLGNSVTYIGTTPVSLGRASGILALTGIASIDGNAATVTNGVYTTGLYADPSWITSLSATKLTGTISIANGGTGATTAAGARVNLGVAGSGANNDITSLSGLTTALSAGQGGTGINAATAVNGTLLIGNGGGFTLANLTAGSGIGISNGSGTITLTSAPPLSSITAATTANTINNGVNQQNWNWQLTGNTTGYAIGENVASTGGTGAQYLQTISTLAGSTAIPLSVRTRGVEAFHVDSVNPQLVANAGSVAAPSYSFSSAKNTGVYADPSGSLALSSLGVRVLNLNNNSMGLGLSTLEATTGLYNTAIGPQAMRYTSTGVSNTAVGRAALFGNDSGSQNSAFGKDALFNNINGGDNVANGYLALFNNFSGGANVAVGSNALYYTKASNNVAVGYTALYGNTFGANNTAVGYQSGYYSSNSMVGSNLSFFGANSTIGNSPAMAGSSNITLLGANTSASGLASANASAYMSAVGAGASVTSINSVVLGRASTYTSGLPSGDKTIIGSTADSGAAALLQVNGAIQYIGQTTAARPTGSAGMLYYDSTLGRFQFNDGTAYRDLTFGAAGSGTSLSSITAATAANTINNGANQQNWNWQLTGNTTGYAIGENVASTGGAGTQYLQTISTLGGSTAIPLSVSVRGSEAFRVDSVNPQLVANTGTAAAPSYSFNGNQGTGFYLSAANELAASSAGVRTLQISPTGPVALGYGALLNNSSGTSTGIGYQALKANTTGADNTATGYNVLTANTTGYSNAGFGVYALASNIGGNNNSGFGFFALRSNTSGNFNTATGGSALYTNSTGNQNTATGYAALTSNTGGSNNVATGDSALRLNSTGNYNAAFGSGALYNTSTGSYNVGTGNAALSSNTTGTNNVGVGANALYLANGSYNTALGNAAGNTVTNSITGTYNTFLGASSNLADNATTASSGYITLVGANTTANLAASNASAYATAIGAGSSVTTANSIVLGRASTYTAGLPSGDKTIIGATADSGAAALLQVNGAVQFIGQNTPPTGSAGMMYYDSTTQRLKYYTGSVYSSLTSLSSLTPAELTSSTIANGANTIAWNWTLAANSTAYAIGETSASTGGTGTQYLHTIGTLSGSTAIPLSVSSRGVEAFRVDSVNPQLVANIGTAAAPSYSFTGSRATGLYLPALNVLGASVAGIKSLYVDNVGITALGSGVLGTASTGTDMVAFGYRSLQGNRAGSRNTAVGSYSSYFNRNGSDNTATGYGALATILDGIGNSAFGSNALFNANGSSNSAFGFNAMKGQGNTSDNSAFGAYSLSTNNSGTLNAAFGSHALEKSNNTSGNSAFGAYALALQTTGGGSSAFGSNALTANTIGIGNSSFGTNSLQANTTGNSNSAFGGSALQNNTTGIFNTAVGYNALYSNTTSSGNVAVGHSALSSGLANTVIGSNNTAIGYQSGTTTNNNITGNKNTLLGNNATLTDDTTTTASSFLTLLGADSRATLAVANANAYATAIGAGSLVTSANTVILGRATDNVAIGQTFNGAYQFTVNGTAGGTSAYAVSSDRRFKKDITGLKNALGTIEKLQGVSYEFNQAAFPDRKFESGRQIGFIAQQIEQFVPEVVRTDSNGYKSVQYSQLVPLLVEGIKEQQTLLSKFVQKNDTTISLGIPVFQADKVVAAMIDAQTIKVAKLDAETARIKKLEADSIKTGTIKTGSSEIFAQAGMSYPLFKPETGGQYIVSATADDGSAVMYSAALVAGKVTLTPISGTGIEFQATEENVNVMAPGKNIKATWLKMG